MDEQRMRESAERTRRYQEASKIAAEERKKAELQREAQRMRESAERTRRYQEASKLNAKYSKNSWER